MNPSILPPMRSRAPAAMSMQFHTPFLNTTLSTIPLSKAIAGRPVAPSVPAKKSASKGMSWGVAVWYLYHTLAYKVHEDAFPALRDQLLNFIRGISSVLPCPKCSEHATEYMTRVNFSSIQTKAQLKSFLYAFHNTVNGRKEEPIMLPEEADEKYRLAKTIAIIRNFTMMFQQKQNNARLITDQMHRENLVAKFNVWIQENMAHFDP